MALAKTNLVTYSQLKFSPHFITVYLLQQIDQIYCDQTRDVQH